MGQELGVPDSDPKEYAPLASHLGCELAGKSAARLVPGTKVAVSRRLAQAQSTIVLIFLCEICKGEVSVCKVRVCLHLPLILIQSVWMPVVVCLRVSVPAAADCKFWSM